MRTPARPRLPDEDCVFISGVHIVAFANHPDHIQKGQLHRQWRLRAGLRLLEG